MKKTVFNLLSITVRVFAALGVFFAGNLTLEADETKPLPISDEMQRVVPHSTEALLLSFSSVVRKASPAVVNIYTRKKVTVNSSPFFNDPFFQRFFGNAPMGVPQERILSSLGSGVIVAANGTLVTNNHVIGGADTIQVVLADRREYEADVLLADPRTDLAVLKLRSDEKQFPYLEFYNSDEVQVGDLALAIGNPFGLGQTVTSGIVSAVARSHLGINDFQFFIQTDAAVNMGNSGGALVALDGRLIGINSNILSHTGDSAGIGFAIPSNMVRWVVKAATSGGQLIRPWIGVSGQAVDGDTAKSLGLDRPGGVLVNSLYPGGPGDKAGIRPGDVILSVRDHEIVDSPGLTFRIATAEANKSVPVRIFRNGSVVSLSLVPILPPENPPREETLLKGEGPFKLVTVANLSPRLSDELGLDYTENGVVVLGLDSNAPAARRGFVRQGDVILSYNGKTITRVADLKLATSLSPDGVSYRLKRNNRLIDCRIDQKGRSFYCQEG